MTTIEIKRYEELQPAAIRAVLKNHAGEKGRQFGLDFVPMTNEWNFFVCCQETLLSPELDMMRVLLRTLGHSATAQVLPTDDGLEALGEVFGLVSCFPPET